MDEAIVVLTSLEQETVMGQTPSKQQASKAPAPSPSVEAAECETRSSNNSTKQEPTPSKMTRSQTQQNLIISEQSRLENENPPAEGTTDQQDDVNSQENIKILLQSPCKVQVTRLDLNVEQEKTSMTEGEETEQKIHLTRNVAAEQQKSMVLLSPCKVQMTRLLEEEPNADNEQLEFEHQTSEPKISPSKQLKLMLEQKTRLARQKLNFDSELEQEKLVLKQNDGVPSPCKVQVTRLDAQKQKKECLEQIDVGVNQNVKNLEQGSPCKVEVTRLDLLQHSGTAAAVTQQQLLEQELESDRSDGSDSGLGSDAIERDLSVILQQQQRATSSSTTAVIPRGALKRSGGSNSAPGIESEGASQAKRPRRAVTFDAVTVYYFPRAQGFCCVPSQGGSTLGMSARHFSLRRYTIAEHCLEQRRGALRRARRSAAAAQRRRDNNDTSNSDDDDDDDDDDESSSDECDDENDSDSENANPITEIEDEEEEEEEPSIPCPVDDPPSPVASSGVLLPVPARQRRALLRSSGVRKIDAAERDECRTVRQSREFCGCECRGFCDPETCACSRAGVKCQVDRPGFPCGCYKDGCANIAGRAEFNPNRVRTHFIHTLMRLDLEEKQRATEQRNSQHSNHHSQNLLYGNMGTGSYYHNGGSSVSTPSYPDLFAPYGDYGYEGYVYPTYEDPPPMTEMQSQQQHRIQTPAPISSSNDIEDETNRSITVDAATCEENFAEIIKNSMVDTVSA